MSFPVDGQVGVSLTTRRRDLNCRQTS